MSENFIVWILRLITIIAIVAPLTFYYFTSGSLSNFIMPVLNPPQEFISFDPNSIHIISINYTATDGKYLLNVKLYNSGNTKVGLNKLNARITVPSSNIDGKIILQAPFILESNEEESVHILFLLEKGSIEELMIILEKGSPVNLSGNITFILNSIEVPFEFLINNFRFPK
jgi:hypothetical protein